MSEFEEADNKSALDALMQERTKPRKNIGRPPGSATKPKTTKSDDTPFSINSSQVAAISNGLLIALDGLTKLPFKDTDPDLKNNLDTALAYLAEKYGGEFVAKYLPFIQVAFCMGLITMQAYEKKQKQLKAHATTEESHDKET